MVSLVHAGILATLRQLARSYTTSPLPDWDEFAGSTRLESVDAKDRLPPVRTTSTWLSAAW